MNKDKAIQLLERLQDPEPYEPMLTRDAYDALQMAIDALSADGDTISREAAVEALDDAEDAFGYLTRDWREVLNELPPVQPEPSQVAKDIARIVENGQDMRVIGQPEIIFCKDCKKQNRHYHESPYKDTVCPLTAWRGKARGHEYDYQFCCYAERREVKEK